MKRRAAILAAGMAVLIPVLVLFAGRRPFLTPDAADIQTASVELLPPDVSAQLAPAEAETLAELLRQVRVKWRDDPYTEYCGQAVIFTLTMTDGTVRKAMAYNPFLVIDGVGWRTAYAPCEALNAFGNRLAL